MQRLMGKVFYSIRCTDAARKFTTRLLDLLRFSSSQPSVYIPQDARLDAIWLRTFLPLFNGTTLMKPQVAERVAFVDACLTGAGGLCAYHGFYYVTFPDYFRQLQLTIASLECFNVLVAVRLWAPEWAGKKVILYCDNWATVCSLNSGSAQDHVIRGAGREIWLLCALFDIYLVVRHRPGSQMAAADLLSRASQTPAFLAKMQLFQTEFAEPRKVLNTSHLAPPFLF